MGGLKNKKNALVGENIQDTYKIQMDTLTIRPNWPIRRNRPSGSTFSVFSRFLPRFSQDFPRTFPGFSQDFLRTIQGLSKDFTRNFYKTLSERTCLNKALLLIEIRFLSCLINLFLTTNRTCLCKALFKNLKKKIQDITRTFPGHSQDFPKTFHGLKTAEHNP